MCTIARLSAQPPRDPLADSGEPGRTEVVERPGRLHLPLSSATSAPACWHAGQAGALREARRPGRQLDRLTLTHLEGIIPVRKPLSRSKYDFLSTAHRPLRREASTARGPTRLEPACWLAPESRQARLPPGPVPISRCHACRPRKHVRRAGLGSGSRGGRVRMQPGGQWAGPPSPSLTWAPACRQAGWTLGVGYWMFLPSPVSRPSGPSGPAGRPARCHACRLRKHVRRRFGLTAKAQLAPRRCSGPCSRP